MLSKMKSAVDHVFNWKKNPGSIFLITGPLTVLGLGLMLLNAVLQYKLGKGIGYLVIWTAVVSLGGFAIYKILNAHRQLCKILGKDSAE